MDWSVRSRGAVHTSVNRPWMINRLPQNVPNARVMPLHVVCVAAATYYYSYLSMPVGDDTVAPPVASRIGIGASLSCNGTLRHLRYALFRPGSGTAM